MNQSQNYCTNCIQNTPITFLELFVLRADIFCPSGSHDFLTQSSQGFFPRVFNYHFIEKITFWSGILMKILPFSLVCPLLGCSSSLLVVTILFSAPFFAVESFLCVTEKYERRKLMKGHCLGIYFSKLYQSHWVCSKIGTLSKCRPELFVIKWMTII